jgi:hypothetical protein
VSNRKDGPAKIPTEPINGPDSPTSRGGKTPVLSKNSVRVSAGWRVETGVWVIAHLSVRLTNGDEVRVDSHIW